MSKDAKKLFFQIVKDSADAEKTDYKIDTLKMLSSDQWSKVVSKKDDLSAILTDGDHYIQLGSVMYLVHMNGSLVSYEEINIIDE